MSEPNTSEIKKPYPEMDKTFTGWTQMMSYPELLEKVKAGAPLPRNLLRLGFSAETLPETEQDFYEQQFEKAKNGPPYCAGTYCGTAHNCTNWVNPTSQIKTCKNCIMAIAVWYTAGSRPGSVCTPMRG